ncbi:uncharacterized protein FLJ26957 [Oryzias latipes]|uniref:uncharacterized protein FLJ26957 n=1 Tax=Oryzias latipes TaxID=8090 RepID=UPI0009D9F795|nr:uncharacterized protein FLJ26957 [Oryzias latipes]XP_020561981.1 uncharacterized protein FLJ26957 [Oryzias latipes]
MEDVVLHFPPQSADGLGSLLEWTEKLLEPFPCRRPPLFQPWFADGRLPIRPARPAPVIPASEKLFPSTQPGAETTSENGHADGTSAEDPRSPRSQWSKDVSETPNPPGNKDVAPIRQSWIIFPLREPFPHSCLLSKHFDSTINVHRLHLRQRAKWVITKHNCGSVEKVWRFLNRPVRRSRLPTCNANLQRERAEVWVFCDVLFAEQVGRLLKEELRLSGSIFLSVHRLGRVFSM